MATTFRGMRGQRKFNGKTYKRFATYTSKAEAQKSIKMRRQVGKFGRTARMTHTTWDGKKAYTVWDGPDKKIPKWYKELR